MILIFSKRSDFWFKSSCASISFAFLACCSRLLAFSCLNMSSLSFSASARLRKYRNENPAVDDTNKIITDIAATADIIVENGHSVSLDSHQKGTLGGSGRTFNWSIAKEIAKRHDFLLAGGLNSDNIDGALDKVDPWGVDVSSGVETSGIKDVDKIIDFARRVHNH